MVIVEEGPTCALESRTFGGRVCGRFHDFDIGTTWPTLPIAFLTIEHWRCKIINRFQPESNGRVCEGSIVFCKLNVRELAFNNHFIRRGDACGT